jgi:hypothetical protein
MPSILQRKPQPPRPGKLPGDIGGSVSERRLDQFQSGGTNFESRGEERGGAAAGSQVPRVQLLVREGRRGPAPRRSEALAAMKERVREIAAGTGAGPSDRSPRNCGAISRAGRSTSGSRRRPASSPTSTNGSAAAWVSLNSSSGSAGRRSSANYGPGASPRTWRRWPPHASPEPGGGWRGTRRFMSRCPQATSTAWESRGLRVTSTTRTAGCGPARPVVWEGSSRGNRLSPIPILDPANARTRVRLAGWTSLDSAPASRRCARDERMLDAAGPRVSQERLGALACPREKTLRPRGRGRSGLDAL